jgi:hypothetical protein
MRRRAGCSTPWSRLRGQIPHCWVLRCGGHAAAALPALAASSRSVQTDASSSSSSDDAAASLKPLLELCRRRGFVYPCSDIYGGMANAFDFGPLGAQLRWNLRRAWWRDMVLRRVDTVGLESATLLHPEVWRAAGPFTHGY